MNKKETLAFESTKNLLSKNNLDIGMLISQLDVNYIRGSGKGGQKRNKTSSTVQLIDKFNYSRFLPEENKNLYKEYIVIKMDQGRSQKTNYSYAMLEWLNKIKKLFYVQKTRTKNLKIENERKKKISSKYKDIKQSQKYRNRFE